MEAIWRTPLPFAILDSVTLSLKEYAHYHE